MTATRFGGVIALTALTSPACSGEQEVADYPTTGPAYILTTEGADPDVYDVLLSMLRERCKPVRVATPREEPIEFGTIHVAMRVSTIKYESTDGTEKVGIPTQLRASVAVRTLDGSSNWDGEHDIGFETERPRGSFSDAAEVRRRWTRKLLEVALKQLPDRGNFVLAAAAPR